MSHLIKEKIKQGSLVIFFILFAFVVVLVVLSVFSDNGQGSVSIKNEVGRKTIKDTERMLSVYTNKAPKIMDRMVRDDVQTVSRVTHSDNNGPVTGKLDLSGISFDIKNAK
jgi:hypothetical protein